MNLFISWSEERSQMVAQAFRPWIKCVIQAIEPFFSQNDISGGSVWINKLNEKLAASNAGIICLTPENQHREWIQFEAGALAKGLSENRVFILLIGMEPHEVTGPLASFNHTKSTKEEIKKMVFNINELLGDKSLNIDILNRVFEKYYGDFEEELKKAINHPVKDKPLKRKDSDMQIEILDLLRGLSSRVSRIESKINKSDISTLKDIQNLARISRQRATIDPETTTATTTLSDFFKIGEEYRNHPELLQNLSVIFKNQNEESSGSSSSGKGGI